MGKFKNRHPKKLQGGKMTCKSEWHQALKQSRKNAFRTLLILTTIDEQKPDLPSLISTTKIKT